MTCGQLNIAYASVLIAMLVFRKKFLQRSATQSVSRPLRNFICFEVLQMFCLPGISHKPNFSEAWEIICTQFFGSWSLLISPKRSHLPPATVIFYPCSHFISMRWMSWGFKSACTVRLLSHHLYPWTCTKSLLQPKVRRSSVVQRHWIYLWIYIKVFFKKNMISG